MTRILVLCAVALALAGCGRADSPLAPPNFPSRDGALIINGFNEADTLILSQQWYRVGGYYDFSSYSYVTIDFNVQRSEYAPTSNRITIRIGPSMYLTDTVSTSEGRVSLRIAIADLSKPQMSAVTFINPDADATLILSHLRIVGWRK